MEIINTIFQIIGTIALLFFAILAVITIIAFFFLRKKYYFYRTLWRGKRNFFTIVIFPFVEWVFNAYAFANKGGEYTKLLYHYKTAQFIMSKPEHDCYDALLGAVGDHYRVFPQIHLSTFLSEVIPGQNYEHARRHINQKSVDFLLCDKTYLNPKLAIELDDATHSRPDRIERDDEVARILRDANFPLLRLTHADFSLPEILKSKILILIPQHHDRMD